jgi:hypothetical protein
MEVIMPRENTVQGQSAENTENSVEKAASAGTGFVIKPPTVEAGTGRANSRATQLSVEGADGSKKTMSRKEYVLARWSAGVDRGVIAKELTALEGKAIKYQTVHAITKGIPQGAKPAVAAA